MDKHLKNAQRIFKEGKNNILFNINIILKNYYYYRQKLCRIKLNCEHLVTQSRNIQIERIV